MRLVLLVAVPVVVLGVVLAGFVMVTSAGRSVAAGEHTEPYQAYQHRWSQELGVCTAIGLTGQIGGTWLKPSWSLRGPGWKNVALSRVRATISVRDKCPVSTTAGLVLGTEVPAQSMAVTQYWATETCAEASSSSAWPVSTIPLAGCPADRVTGSGSLFDDPEGINAALEPPTSLHHTLAQANLEWDGTTYDPQLCARASLRATLQVNGRTDDLVLDGYRVCLDAE